MKNIIAYILIILLTSMSSCKKSARSNENILKTIKQTKNIDTFVQNLKKDVYDLQIETSVLNDTLDVIDYKEDQYSTPIINYQKIIFYQKDKIIRKYNLPLKEISKKTISGKNIKAIETPIYSACISNDFYILQGAAYCNGAACPEFTGIYNMNGKIIYEGFSYEKEKERLKNIRKKNKINLNKLSNCINIDVHY